MLIFFCPFYRKNFLFLTLFCLNYRGVADFSGLFRFQKIALFCYFSAILCYRFLSVLKFLEIPSKMLIREIVARQKKGENHGQIFYKW